MLSGEDKDGVFTHEFFIHTSGNTDVANVGEVDNAFKDFSETNGDQDKEIDGISGYEEIDIKQEVVFVNGSIEYNHETDQDKESEVGETDPLDIADAETETSDVEESPFRKIDEFENNSASASISICFICFGNTESIAMCESANAQHNMQINSLCNGNDIGVDSVLKLAPFVVVSNLKDLTATASSVNSNELFEIFCRYLNVSSADSPSKSMEYSLNFPLCKSCRASLINLLIYHNQMEKLNQLTKQITSTLTARIVESYEKEKTKYRTQLAPCQCALRQQIYKRYNVKVSLHDVKDDSESNYNSDIFENENYEESNISNSEMTSGIPEVEIDCSSRPSLVQCSSRTSVHNKITNTSCASPCPDDQDQVTRFSNRAAVSSNLPNSSNDDSNNNASNSDKVHQMQHKKNPRKRRRINKGSKQNNKMVEVSTNMFLYANKYFIKKGKSKFKCCLCGLKRERKYKLLEHIRKEHIKNKPLLNSKKKIQLTSSQLTQEPLGPSAHIEKVNEQSEISNNNCDQYQFVSTPLPQLEPQNEERTCTMNSLIPSSDKIISASSTTMSNIAAENTDSEDSDYQPRGNRKYVEVEPDKFVYAKKYIYVKLGQGYKCHTCGFTCNVRRGINTHIRNTHLRARKTTRVNNKWEEVSPGKYVYAHQYPVEEMEGRFKCCTCEYTTKGKYKMFEHLRTKHMRPVVEESYMCDLCGKTYNRVDSLRSHKKLSCAMIPNAAKGSDEQYACNVCKKCFKNEEYLKQHRRVHSGDDKKNFVCEFCGAKFWGSSRLKDHMAQHTGDKLFECQFCPSRFTTYNNMHYHRIREHGRVGDLTGIH